MHISHKRQQVVRTQYKRTKNIRQFLGELKIGHLSKKLLVMKRTPRKFTMSELLMGYWELSANGQFSYDNWATRVSGLIGKTVSGQAICKRMNPEMTVFLKHILNKAMARKSEKLLDIKLFRTFSNVLVQDATHFRLPKSLSEFFPGSFSKFGASANAKVQAVFNLKKGIFIDFRIYCFRDNDQKDAPHIASMLGKGDLTIRDLGYSTLEAFRIIKDKGSHFLSRFKYGLSLYDPNNGQQIDLLKYLEKHGTIDRQVEIGAERKIQCRIVAVPLADQVVAERIRKAKADRNSSTNHKKEYYQMLKYSIYITTVEQDVWTVQQVAEAYRCRWYIEILFKAWKSGLRMKFNIPPRYTTKHRAEFFLYANLILIVLQVIPLFNKASEGIDKSLKHLSIIKVCTFILLNMSELMRAKTVDSLLKQMRYHCTYESRKDRINSLEYMMPINC